MLRFYWNQVAPSVHAFDASAARAIVTRLITSAAADKPVKSIERRAFIGTIDLALAKEFGPWVRGWNWATSEPGGGGPIRNWCCERDSLFNKQDKDPIQQSIERAVASVVEWREFLEQLESMFALMPNATARRSAVTARDIEVAAAQLLTLIVERTTASDAWYNTFATVLTWCLEAKGCDAKLVEPIVDRIVGGQFQSWVGPDDATQATACAELGTSIALAEEGVERSDDSLTEWLAIRKTAFKKLTLAGKRAPLNVDGHRLFITTFERERDDGDGGRADAMEVALDACRLSAGRDEPLTLDRLADWQAIVLGVPRDAVSFRTTTAYAKDGREHYGLEDGLAQIHFEDCLDEANDDDAPVPIAIRAARVYLDVCFFHPFADGNARAARLALDHVLSRGGFGLRDANPIFRLSRLANDANGAGYFAQLVDHLMSVGQSPHR